MTKEFVTYEQAVVLKKLGFNEPCIGYYYNNKIHFNSPGVNFVGPSGEQPLPLKQQVFRWFREKHKQSVYPIWRIDNSWDLHIQQLDGYGLLSGQQALHVVKTKTYEEAEDACIDKLIEIIKNKDL